jgi:hypothetical protein
VNVLDEWTRTVSRALGLVDDAIDRDLILDLTKDVAHNVARPAAPLTAFLVGLAAGKAGGSADDVRRAAEKAASLANGYGTRRGVSRPPCASNGGRCRTTTGAVARHRVPGASAPCPPLHVHLALTDRLPATASRV